MDPKFETLPNELITEIIFKFIPMCQWSGLERVSTQFQSAVLAAYGGIKSLNLRKLYSLKRRPKNRGRQLIFNEKTAASQRLNNILNKLTTLCPNLTEVLGFEHVACNIDAESLNILKKFSGLESISIKGLRGRSIPFERFADFIVSEEIKLLDICGSGFDVDGTLDVGLLESIAISGPAYSHGNAILEKLSENLTTLKIHTFESAFQSHSEAKREMIMCPNLESFSLHINSKKDYKTFFKILPNLRKLTKLSISNSTRHWVCLFGTDFCNGLDFLKDHLRVIDISHVDLSFEAQIFLFSKCPRLEILELDWLVSPLSANSLQNLSNLPDGLKKLTFQDPDGQIYPLLMPKLVQLKNFNDLTIVSDDSPESSVADWENICALTHLQHLRLYGRFVDDALLVKWDQKNGEMFGKLISLSISCCPLVTDVGGCLLAKKAKNMQILNLWRSSVTDKSIAAFGESAKKLTSVNFVQIVPYLFDENAILSFIKKSINLKKLRIDIKLAENVVRHVDFLPFVEYVEIEEDSILTAPE